MSFSQRLKNIISIAFTDKKAADEFLGLFQESVGALVAGGTFNTVGGDALEAISAPGVLATDLAMVIVSTQGATPRAVIAAAAAADAINVVLDGDPAADHVLTYMVFRV